MTLVEFLEARIAEDEREVDTAPDFIEDPDSARSPGWGNRGDCPICGHFMFDGNESVTKEGWWDHVETYHKRTRVLAECEAKRRIVKEIESTRRATLGITGGSARLGVTYGLDVILRALALPYADHPDYRAEWRG